MLQILIVDDEPEILDIIVMLIKMKFNAEITSALSGRAAINELKQNPNFDLIICDYSMPDGNGDIVYSFIKEQKLNIPFVLHTAVSLEDIALKNEDIVLFPKPANFADFTQLLKKMLPDEKEETEIVKGEYCSINLTMLLKAGTLPGDIYIKLSDNKFVKILLKDNVFCDEDFQKYKIRGINKLYFEKKDSKLILDRLINDITLSYRDVSMAQLPEAYIITQNVHEVLHETFLQLGVTEEFKKAIDQSVAFSINAIKVMSARDKAYQKLFDKIALHRDKYISSHSSALAFVAATFANKLDWKSEVTLAKLTTAALLHDIVLASDFSYDDHVIFLDRQKTESILYKMSLADYVKHPQASSEIVINMIGIPEEVDRIILEHHELPDGTGFPKQLTSVQISPLSAVFILAHNMLDYMYANNTKNGLEFLLHLSDDYHKGSFKPIVAKLKECILDQRSTS